jgi:hypothetical protein
MKRTQLAETGIVIIILVLLYQFLISLMQLITSLLLYTASDIPGDKDFLLFGFVFPLVMYLLVVYLLIMYKKPLARLIAGKDNTDASVGINISGNWLLQITLIIICIIVLISELPGIISYLLKGMSWKKGNDDNMNGLMITDSIESAAFWPAVIKSGLVLLVLLFSKKIAGIWKYKNESDPVHH